MNDRLNKWIMFSKRLERKERLGALAEAHPAIPCAMPEKRLVGLHSGGPRAPRDAMLPPIRDHRNRYLQSIHCEFKIFIILKYCYLMFFHYSKIKRIFQNYTRQTGASGNISPMNKKIIDVFSAFKHVEADIVGSSSGYGILNSGNEITVTKLLLVVISTSGAQ